MCLLLENRCSTAMLTLGIQRMSRAIRDTIKTLSFCRFKTSQEHGAHFDFSPVTVFFLPFRLFPSWGDDVKSKYAGKINLWHTGTILRGVLESSSESTIGFLRGLYSSCYRRRHPSQTPVGVEQDNSQIRFSTPWAHFAGVTAETFLADAAFVGLGLGTKNCDAGTGPISSLTDVRMSYARCPSASQSGREGHKQRGEVFYQ